MLAFRIEFVAGRFYATPWGRSVNEGIPEWPPAPFRLQRALISSWFRAGRPEPEGFDSILHLLAEPPVYCVPPSVSSHVRHYMPGYHDDEKSKVFNAFTAPQGPLHVIWDRAELDPGRVPLLTDLLQRLDYLGRSESWVDIRLDSSPPPANLVVTGTGKDPDIHLLCSIKPAEWFELRSRVRDEESNRLIAGKTEAGRTPRLSPRERAAIESITPEAYTEALAVDTGVLRENGWQYPPVARKVGYSWVDGQPSTEMRSKRRLTRQTATLARYLVSSEVMPGYTELVTIAERARRTLMGIVGARNDGVVPQALSGRSPDGKPTTTGHMHTYFIPEPGRNSMMISHLNVYCPAGFPDVVRDNLPRLDRIWGSGGHDIRLVLLTTGTPETMGGVGRDQSPSMATAAEWVSQSPFIPSRHLKIRRSELHDPLTFTEAVVREIDRTVRQELDFHGKPAPERVELLPPCPGLGYGVFLKGHFTSWLDFRTTRLMGDGSRGGRTPYGIRIVFPEPVTGPICLGYASHFGLGSFKPAENG